MAEENEVIVDGEIVEEVDLDKGAEDAEVNGVTLEPGENDNPELDADGKPKETADDEDGEVTVTIDGEEPEDDEEPAPAWVKDLRKQNREDKRQSREDQKEIKTLRAKLAEKESPAKTALGEKPTLEGCLFDPEEFESELDMWHERRRQADTEKATKDKESEQQQTAWNEKLESYGTKKAELKVADYDEAEASVQDHLDVTQQGIIVQGADNPALVIYALGRNEKKAKELAAIKDPVKFTFAVAKLETQLKVSGKKTPPPPEKKVTGTGSSGAVDSTLDKLRKDAEKSGDFTKVSAYKRSKRQA